MAAYHFYLHSLRWESAPWCRGSDCPAWKEKIQSWLKYSKSLQKQRKWLIFLHELQLFFFHFCALHYFVTPCCVKYCEDCFSHVMTSHTAIFLRIGLWKVWIAAEEESLYSHTQLKKKSVHIPKNLSGMFYQLIFKVGNVLRLYSKLELEFKMEWK